MNVSVSCASFPLLSIAGSLHCSFVGLAKVVQFLAGGTPSVPLAS